VPLAKFGEPEIWNREREKIASKIKTVVEQFSYKIAIFTFTKGFSQPFGVALRLEHLQETL
jgi:hypothetical protein